MFAENRKIFLKLVYILIILVMVILLGFILFKDNNKAKQTYTMQNINVIEKKSNIVEKNSDSNKIIVVEIEKENIETTINVEEVEEVAENNTSENDNNNTNNKINATVNSGKKYYIKVNYGANVVTIYEKDANGDYTIPIKAMICSTGTYTPKSGVYDIKLRWEWLGLQGNVYGHYSTQITGNILFHSVPYLRKGDSGSIEYWEYDKLGTTCSAGCVRLTIQDARWIFYNIEKGTQVEFYSSQNPGPLGKPSAKKISQNEQCRDWDPTDPDPNNPWLYYDENKIKEEERIKEEQKKKEEEQKRQLEKQKQEEQEKENKNKNNNIDEIDNENAVDGISNNKNSTKNEQASNSVNNETKN